MSTDTRTIHTDLYSDRAENILSNFFKFLRQAGSTRQEHVAEAVKFSRAPDGEVLIDAYLRGAYVTGIRSYGFTSYATTIWDHKEKPDSALKLWMAVNIKQSVIKSSKSDGVWRRNNGNLITAFCDRDQFSLAAVKDKDGNVVGCPTIEELYFIYDFFLGRQNLTKKYSKDLIDSILGFRRDPVLTEIEVNRRAEIERIKEEANTAIHAAYNKLKLDRDELDKEYTAKIREIENLRDTKITELNEKTDAILKTQAA